MQHQLFSLGLAIAAVAALVGAPTSNRVLAQQRPAPTYQFAVIADSADGFDPFEFGCAAINDQGQVAFRATRTNGVTIVARGTGRALTIIANNRNRFGFVGQNPAINTKGQVSFAAGLTSGGEGIFRGDGGALSVIARTEPGPYSFFSDNDTALNKHGDVAFVAELDTTFDQGIFVGDGRNVQTRVLTSSSQFDGTPLAPSINDQGQVAFEAELDTGERGIFRSDGRRVVTIATDSTNLDSLRDPHINKDGVVVFRAFRDEGGEEIVAGSGGALTTIATTDGPFSSFGFGGPASNEKGKFAWTATLDTGEQGLFTGPDPATDRVIGTGDPLSGSTVTNVVFCNNGLNADGALAFQAQLGDGRTVIVRADPRRGRSG